MSALNMKYFVLKPEGSSEYARASRKAMRTFASKIRPSNKELSDDLRDWADQETTKSNELAGKEIINDTD